ncbi:hypothetical protein GA0116948_109130 [Chitinophaga costaii]|uniref:Uncharacterized protein n=1 Tax=Chitinophaga costaii TaxID=1335309 RepID=A0A1C4EQV1_9BACT|nr:hypothetical protein GA0116948_109130 [Chitinophaga costaii]
MVYYFDHLLLISIASPKKSLAFNGEAIFNNFNK